MCWDTQAQRRNTSASPLRDAAVPQSLRVILFKWVPCRRKRSQGHSVFTSGVPNMSGTRLTCKKFDLSRRVFQLGTPLPSLAVDGPDLPGRISVERLITPRCGRHLPSSRPGSLRWSAPSPTEIRLGCDAKFFSVPSATPSLTGVRPHTSPYEPYACSVFLARVFPGGRASGSVWLTDWPISWGEHTLSPSLSVVHQKKKFFFYPQKSRQGLMAQPWAILATLVGRVAGQPYGGGSLPWRNIDFFCQWAQGPGVWSNAWGGQTGKKI